jgi:PmbA protein
MELAQHADTVERLLSGRQLDGYEIMVTQSHDLTVESKGGKLDAFKCAEPFGIAVRVKSGDGLGFSFSTTMDPQALSRMIDGAITAAGVQSHDPDYCLPLPPAGYPIIPNFRDDNLPLISQEEKAARVLELERLVLAQDPRVKRVRKCSYADSSYAVYIRNSRGLDAGYRGSQVSCSASAVAEEGGDAQIGWDFDFSNSYAGLQFEKTAERAARKATSLLGARTIPTMHCPAVLDNHVAEELLDVLAVSFLAENVHKGKSLFRGRVGDKLFSELLTIRDNGLLENGMGTAPYDGEGVPQQDNLLVSGGILHGFLFDSYWGKKMGAASTGNAGRGTIKMPPKMTAHNLFIEPGDNTFESLIAGVSKGVLITDVMGIHTANPISGDFSVGAAGFYIEGGSIMHPVKGIAIAGNLLDLFQSIDAVADDLRFFGTVGSPSLRVSELDISGR